MSVWDVLVGQDDVVAQLSHAVDDADRILRGESGPAMTHAWLITGPPGSGRSTAATCFAAALECPERGCGVCTICRMTASGGTRDVDIVRPDKLTYSVEEARELVRNATLSPSASPWHVIVVEDADRLTEQAANALLKSFEEPPPHTVWLLCAPSVEDVLPTIRSRARHVSLRTPSAGEVAEALEKRFGVDYAIAAFAARASQGHIGRARALATNEQVRLRRQETLRTPFELNDLPACAFAAANLVEAATEDAAAITDALDAQELADFEESFGIGVEGMTKAKFNRMVGRPKKELEAAQKSRRTRTVRDQIDRALVDLIGLYRDVLVIQMDADVGLINEEMRPQIATLASQSTPDETGLRINAIERGRQMIAASVAPLLAIEALMVELKAPGLRRSVGLPA